MLRRLRWQLTLLYLLAALGLVALVGGGSYSLLLNSYAFTTDLSIQYRMATLFQSYGLTLPSELSSAQKTWLDRNASFLSSAAGSQVRSGAGEESPHSEEAHEGEEEHREGEEERHTEELYDARLAAIFILPLDAQGNLLFNPNPGPPPISQDKAAVSAAVAKGADLRTIRLSNGGRARILTYRTNSVQAPEIFQIGRLLSDQDLALSQFRTNLFLLAGLGSVLLGLGSWWLSGRTLGPAQQAWDQQQAFVSNASHELRTPLTLMRANAEYALRGHPEPELERSLRDILGECDYMNRLVDDLLLLSRLDTRHLQLQREHISLASLLDEVLHQGEKLAGEKRVTIIMTGDKGVAWGDRTRLRQVLLILLDNALRFTSDGGTIRLESTSQGKTTRIQVQDDGRGIAPEHLAHVFERFYQVPGSQDGERRHNGLGLSIARSLIESQGGKIKIESRVGEGTTVTVFLPAA